MMTGFVRIFLARAAYLSVLFVSHKFERAGEMHAIIRVTPLPASESASSCKWTNSQFYRKTRYYYTHLCKLTITVWNMPSFLLWITQRCNAVALLTKRK